MTNIDQLAIEINQSLQIGDSDAPIEREGPQSVQNLSFGENQSNGSKQSLGFGAVQSMDGRRHKSKSKKQRDALPNSLATASPFTQGMKGANKKPSAKSSGRLISSAIGNNANQALMEADQIMFDLI